MSIARFEHDLSRFRRNSSPRNSSKLVVVAAVILVATAVLGVLAASRRGTAAPPLTDTRLLFRDDPGLGYPRTYVMDADGGNRYETAQLPDGASICGAQVVHGRTSVRLAGPDTQSEPLLDTPAQNGSPACSPDGSRIAFISNRDGNYEIYLMRVDGGGQRRVTSTPTRIESEVVWSPDGMTLAFSSTVEGSATSDIFVIRADGSGLRQLTDASTVNGHPTWAPSGGRIAFHSARDSAMSASLSRQFDIYVMNADGTDKQRITNYPEPDKNPEWSPDGAAIAFQSTRSGNSIHIVRPDGSDLRRIGRGFAPLWVPPGHPWTEPASVR